jgi:hypothetical protein
VEEKKIFHRVHSQSRERVEQIEGINIAFAGLRS